MALCLSRIGIPERPDPNGWQSWENYQAVLDIQLEQRSFVVRYLDTLDIELNEDTGDLLVRGTVGCEKGVMLDVRLIFEYDDSHIPHRVRCFRYAYIGWQIGGNLLLKYHNLHDNPDDYIHRVYDPATGEEIFGEVLRRHQFPTFPEVLDELEYLARDL